MAAPDAATKEAVANWFARLDPNMQQVLSDIYAEAPGAVSKVISGGAWEADESDPPLTEVVGGGDAGGGAGLSLGNIDLQPWPVTTATPARILFNMYNNNSVEQPAFAITATLTKPDGSTEDKAFECPALPPEGQSEQYMIEIATPEAGSYNLAIVANPDGSPMGSAVGPKGARYEMSEYGFDVSTGDAGADSQNFSAILQAATVLAQLVEGRDPLATFNEGLNWLAAADLSPEQATTVGSLGDFLGRIVDEEDLRRRVREDQLTAVGVAATRARGAQSVDDLGDLFEALQTMLDTVTAE